MAKQPPPPIIDCARVIAYAFVDDIVYRQSGRLYVGDKLLEKVPRLAVCINLGKDIGPMLFHCDDEWNVVGVSGAKTVEAGKERAERNYPGVMSRWVNVNTSQTDGLAYYDATGGWKCAICGKRQFEIEGLYESEDENTCGECSRGAN